jgi:hypothetical protein
MSMLSSRPFRRSGWLVVMVLSGGVWPAMTAGGDQANSSEPRPVDFDTQVVPIFTKHGCNAGGCHGKSGGQNGFRLSLLGFEPAEDHDHVVKEARGRRICVAAPEESLLLLKATGAMPHGGGRVFTRESPSYEVIARWIAEGARPGDPAAPRVERIEIRPPDLVMKPGETRTLEVVAHLSDGSTDDVTRLAQYESNAPELATVDESGLVAAVASADDHRRGGSVAVMARYQSKVAVFRASLPFDAPAEAMPTREAFVRTIVDEHVLDGLAALRLPASPVCDDATFIRRVTLDIAGRLPTLDEAKAFLAETDSAKRDRLVDRLLAGSDYADHFAMKWSAILRNTRTNDDLHRHGSYVFHEWIRRQIDENVPYSEFVRSLLTASGEAGENPSVIWFRQAADMNQQVEDAAQLFLGQRLQCARCHHHPFEAWGTDDYFKFAAFFSRVGRKPGLQPGESRIFHAVGAASAVGPRGTHPPAVLGGPPASLAPDEDPRAALVNWMTASDNPFFARSFVNRYWKHFFGRGIVDPEDDMRLTNPATNGPLLDALAGHFVTHGYDMKDLVRLICRSTTYQLSSEPNGHNAADRQAFSRFYPRRLAAEVALDAIDRVTGKTTAFAGVLPGTRAVQLPDPGFANYFLTVFGRPNGDTACECERGGESNLAQSLHLVNSADILGKLAGGRAAALASDASRDNAAKIEEIYLVALSRPATLAERSQVDGYLAAHSQQPAAAWEDVVWSLINSKEFLFNH